MVHINQIYQVDTLEIEQPLVQDVFFDKNKSLKNSLPSMIFKACADILTKKEKRTKETSSRYIPSFSPFNTLVQSGKGRA